MAWHRPGDKPLSEPMRVSLLMHICVARLQWVNKSFLMEDMDLFILRSQYHGCSVLMSWPHKEPGHQQPWYWPSFPRIFPQQYTKITTVFWGHRLIIFIHWFILVLYHYIPVTSTIQHILIMMDRFNGIQIPPLNWWGFWMIHVDCHLWWMMFKWMLKIHWLDLRDYVIYEYHINNQFWISVDK